MTQVDDRHDTPAAGLARRIPGYTRFIVAVPVIGLLAGAVTLTLIAGIGVVSTIIHAIGGNLTSKDAVLEFIELADVFLLSTVLYIMALGLYELFIDDGLPLPAWLEIHSLDDLKKKLVGVVAVVLAVTFLGIVIKGTDPQSVMYLGAGIAAVVASMGYFLRGDKHS
jgi:uncharacterized membrane protein YqhA